MKRVDATDVLLIGGSIAGATTAEALRRRGFTGSIRLVGDEPHLPYDRPPLSKKVLAGTWTPDQVTLFDGKRLDALGVDVTLGRPAVRLDVLDRVVGLADGSALPYRTLVIATGLRARPLPYGHGLAGVHTLRTLEDAMRLRKDLLKARNVAVIGAGVLGCEIACTARELGVDVTLLDPNPTPMWHQLGPEIGKMIAELHAGNGVELRTGTRVTGLSQHAGRVGGVHLENGGTVPADVVAVAVGSTPATGWLAGSGLTLDDGVVCDERCRAGEGVYAVGDVARGPWEGGTGRRLENRTNATQQAVFVAADILGARERYQPVPYFWSDQYDVRIQVHGSVPGDGELTLLEGDLASRRFVVLVSRGETPVGLVGWNSGKRLSVARREYL
ncbi:NAD(P)/FAD-dependent oxidoreductase [Streptomyces sp. NPDC004457]|uniref:NAD(P)/FAD-dependent oxidoreductase n=1 Tax=Streptomyces spinosus TaxID=2872623 RepID=UPI001CED1A68|nr:FAD-dependent oxidoreductase [Streptomyces spinosus]